MISFRILFSETKQRINLHKYKSRYVCQNANGFIFLFASAILKYILHCIPCIPATKQTNK